MRCIHRAILMIEVQVPKNIMQYEPTLIGPLTARQSIFIGLAAAAEFIYYSIMQAANVSLATDTLVGIGVLIAIPFLALAILKPFGMKPETYFFFYVIPELIGKQDRPYVINNQYQVALNEIKALSPPEEKKEQPKNKSKKKIKSRFDKMYL